MKKILFIIDSLDCGGAEKSLVSLFPLLDYSRMDVSLSVVRRGGVFEEFLPPQVRLVPFPEPGRCGKVMSDILFSALLRLNKLLGIKRHGAELGWFSRRTFLPSFKEAFDVAVAYQQGFPTYYLVRKVNATKKIAWINTDMAEAGYRPGFNRPFYDCLSAVCTVSAALFEKLPRDGFVGKEHLSVILDILNVNLIRNMADAPLEIQGGEGSIKLLTVGRIVPSKCLPLAVKTAEILSTKGIAFIWTIVGDGPDKGLVEKLIERAGLQERVLLTGQQVNPYPYFQHCDIYVQTSSFEGFGLTLSEAKVLHKPIVTTNFSSAYNQITDGENGLIAEMTPESVADKIINIIENPVLKNRLIENTRNEENRTAKTESEKVNHLLLED